MKRGLLLQLSLQQDVTLHACAQVCLIDWSADGKKGMPTEIVVNETVSLEPKVGAPRTNGTRCLSDTDRTRCVFRTDRTRCGPCCTWRPRSVPPVGCLTQGWCVSVTRLIVSPPPVGSHEACRVPARHQVTKLKNGETIVIPRYELQKRAPAGALVPGPRRHLLCNVASQGVPQRAWLVQDRVSITIAQESLSKLSQALLLTLHTPANGAPCRLAPPPCPRSGIAGIMAVCVCRGCC